MNYSIFCVVKTTSGKPKIKAMFIETDFTSARLWFQGFISGEKDTYNYILYKVGEIGEDLKLKGYKIFVCTGIQVKRDEKELKYEQYKLFTEKQLAKKQAENIRKLYKEGVNFEEIIQKAFDGKTISTGN